MACGGLKQKCAGTQILSQLSLSIAIDSSKYQNCSLERASVWSREAGQAAPGERNDDECCFKIPVWRCLLPGNRQPIWLSRHSFLFGSKLHRQGNAFGCIMSHMGKCGKSMLACIVSLGFVSFFQWSNFASQSLVEMGFFFKKKILLLFCGNEFFQAHLTSKQNKTKF